MLSQKVFIEATQNCLKDIDRGWYTIENLRTLLFHARKTGFVKLLDGTLWSENEIACKALSMIEEGQIHQYVFLGCELKKSLKVLDRPEIKISLRDYVLRKAIALENGAFRPGFPGSCYYAIQNCMEDDDSIDMGNGRYLKKVDIQFLYAKEDDYSLRIGKGWVKPWQLWIDGYTVHDFGRKESKSFYMLAMYLRCIHASFEDPERRVDLAEYMVENGHIKSHVLIFTERMSVLSDTINRKSSSTVSRLYRQAIEKAFQLRIDKGFERKDEKESVQNSNESYYIKQIDQLKKDLLSKVKYLKKALEDYANAKAGQRSQLAEEWAVMKGKYDNYEWYDGFKNQFRKAIKAIQNFDFSDDSRCNVYEWTFSFPVY